VYVYKKEKSEHQQKVHVDGKSGIRASSTQCNKMQQYSIRNTPTLKLFIFF
jgi:hypothetical protein